jgi:hypothetical protein
MSHDQEKQMARSDTQTNLRLKKEMKDWLRQQAEANKRSLTSEIGVILEDYQRRQTQQRETAHAT